MALYSDHFGALFLEYPTQTFPDSCAGLSFLLLHDGTNSGQKLVGLFGLVSDRVDAKLMIVTVILQ